MSCGLRPMMGVMRRGLVAFDPSCGAFASRAAPDADYRATSPRFAQGGV